MNSKFVSNLSDTVKNKRMSKIYNSKDLQDHLYNNLVKYNLLGEFIKYKPITPDEYAFGDNLIVEAIKYILDPYELHQNAYIKCCTNLKNYLLNIDASTTITV